MKYQILLHISGTALFLDRHETSSMLSNALICGGRYTFLIDEFHLARVYHQAYGMRKERFVSHRVHVYVGRFMETPGYYNGLAKVLGQFEIGMCADFDQLVLLTHEYYL